MVNLSFSLVLKWGESIPTKKSRTTPADSSHLRNEPTSIGNSRPLRSQESNSGEIVIFILLVGIQSLLSYLLLSFFFSFGMNDLNEQRLSHPSTHHAVHLFIDSQSCLFFLSYPTPLKGYSKLKSQKRACHPPR